MQFGSPDEKALVRRLAAGDRKAFETVYRRHNPVLVRLAASFLRNRATAEEVAQDTWIAVLGGIGGFEGRSSLASWIYTILMNKARTRAVRDGREISFDITSGADTLAGAFDNTGQWKELPEPWHDITPERIVAGRSIMEHVMAAIDELPPGQRSVLILRGQQDLDAAEVCSILGISEANLRVLLHRARLAIRHKLDGLM